jgi:hypothetical protein
MNIGQLLPLLYVIPDIQGSVEIGRAKQQLGLAHTIAQPGYEHATDIVDVRAGL